MMLDVLDKDSIEAQDLGFTLRRTEFADRVGVTRYELFRIINGQRVYTGYDMAEIRAWFAGYRHGADRQRA